jgi:hypothetical protein
MMVDSLKCLLDFLCVLSISQVWNHTENKSGRSVVQKFIKTRNKLQSGSANVRFDSHITLSTSSSSKVSLGMFASKIWCDFKH